MYNVIILLSQLIILSLFGVLFIYNFVLAEDANFKPFCQLDSSEKYCYLFGKDSYNVGIKGKSYSINLEKIDDNGAEFIVNGKSTGYLNINQKKYAGGLIIEAGESEWDEDLEEYVILYNYEKPSVFIKLKCLFSKSC